MNCKKCGSVLSDGVVFCPNCGDAVNETPAENTNVVEQIEQIEKEQPQVIAQPELEVSEVSSAPEIMIVASEDDEMETFINESEVGRLESPKKKSTVGIFIVLLILILAGVGVYFAFFNKEKETAVDPPAKTVEVSKQSDEWFDSYLVDFTNAKFLESIDNFSSIQIMDFVSLHYINSPGSTYCDGEANTTVCTIPALDVKVLVQKYFGIENFIYENGWIETVTLENDIYTIKYPNNIDNSITFKNESVEYSDDNKIVVVTYGATSATVNSTMKIHLKYVKDKNYIINKIVVTENEPVEADQE